MSEFAVPAQPDAKPNFGFARGQIAMAPDFDEIPDEVALIADEGSARYDADL